MLNNLADFLPTQISFYHLGELTLNSTKSDERSAEVPQSLEDLVALGFTLRGDLQAAMVVIFESGLDASMYAEAGNLVVSQLVTTLSNDEGIDLAVSPPLLLDETRLQRLERGADKIIERAYLHSHAKGETLIRTFLFLGLPQAGGAS